MCNAARGGPLLPRLQNDGYVPAFAVDSHAIHLVKRCRGNLSGLSRKIKFDLSRVPSSLQKIGLWLFGAIFGAIIGAFITHQIESFLNREKDEADLAKYYVAAMPLHCKPKTSLELDEKIKRFIEATRRSRANGNGIPIWREDCSIGAQFSITLQEQLELKEK